MKRIIAISGGVAYPDVPGSPFSDRGYIWSAGPERGIVETENQPAELHVRNYDGKADESRMVQVALLCGGKLMLRLAINRLNLAAKPTIVYAD